MSLTHLIVMDGWNNLKLKTSVGMSSGMVGWESFS
jgi:hypothetical protein